MTYDELGRMNQKTVHGGIQTITYTYNIRNWLKSISSPKFTETLYYQDWPNTFAPCYNGNISVQVYGTTTDKMYTFSYDGLNRLKSTSNTSDPIFAENVGSYDKNGNILNIKRNGYVWDELYYTHGFYKVANGTIDDLTLDHNGNQLKSVSDAVYQDLVIANNDFVDKHDAAYPTEYLYDANGNQTADLNKGVAWIRYNLLNLPQKVQFRNHSTNEYSTMLQE